MSSLLEPAPLTHKHARTHTLHSPLCLLAQRHKRKKRHIFNLNRIKAALAAFYYSRQQLELLRSPLNMKSRSLASPGLKLTVTHIPRSHFHVSSHTKLKTSCRVCCGVTSLERTGTLGSFKHMHFAVTVFFSLAFVPTNVSSDESSAAILCV